MRPRAPTSGERAALIYEPASGKVFHAMNVTDLVLILARLLETAPVRCSENQETMIAVLKAMPDYSRRRRLSEWEAQFPEPRDGDDPVAGQLLDAIFALGQYNLYTQFDPAGTLCEYAVVGAKLLAAG